MNKGEEGGRGEMEGEAEGGGRERPRAGGRQKVRGTDNGGRGGREGGEGREGREETCCLLLISTCVCDVPRYTVTVEQEPEKC